MRPVDSPTSFRLGFILVPLCSVGALVAVVTIRQGPWVIDQVDPLAASALWIDFFTFGLSAFALALLGAWLWTLPGVMRRRALIRAGETPPIFEVFRTEDLIRSLEQAVLHPYGLVMPYVSSVTLSPAGLVFWRGSGAPTSIATIPWDAIVSPGSIEGKILRIFAVGPSGEVIGVPLEMRVPAWVGFGRVPRAALDSIVRMVNERSLASRGPDRP